MGYGSRMLHLIAEFFEGNITSLDGAAAGGEASEEEQVEEEEAEGGAPANAKKMPALLVPVQDRVPEKLHWLGTSFGMTQQLFNYWSKASYCPLYCRQTVNPITGEHTVIMLRELGSGASGTIGSPTKAWLPSLVADFRARFRALLSFKFRHLTAELALSLLDPHRDGGATTNALSAPELRVLFTPHDVERLEKYSRNLVDYHLVLDLIPRLVRSVCFVRSLVVVWLFSRHLRVSSRPRSALTPLPFAPSVRPFRSPLPFRSSAFFAPRVPFTPQARLVFEKRFPTIKLSYLQSAIMLSQGLQHKSIDSVAAELELPARQLLALFNKAVRKLRVLLFTVIFHANLAHSLTRSP